MEPQTAPPAIEPRRYLALLQKVQRWIKIIIGGTIALVGIALIFLPGPAIVVIPLGLAILATELVWARQVLKKIKEKVGITEKIKRD